MLIKGHCDRCDRLITQLVMQGTLLLCPVCNMADPMPQCPEWGHTWRAREGGVWLCGMCGVEMISQAIDETPVQAPAPTVDFC